MTQPLPDVDEGGYDEWHNQLFNEDVDRKIHGLGLTHQAGERMADLSVIEAWANAPSVTTAQGRAADLGYGEPPPQPEPEPAPEAAVASPAPTAVPAPRGPPTPPVSPPPSPAPPVSVPAGGGDDDWLSKAFGAATSAGADVGKFVSGLGQGSGDRTLDAMNAVIQAGGDVDRFLSGLSGGRPATPSPTTGPGGGVGGGPLQDYARQAAQKAGVDPDIFVRQIQQESGFNPNARSPAGAQGIAQFMPATAQGMGVDTSDPYSSLDGAARLMANHLQQYGGDYSKALAAYNAGPGNVAKYGGVPPFAETQRYVNIILGNQATPSDVLTNPLGTGNAARTSVPRDLSQFGDSQLTNDEAYAACGPAAAVRFAQRFGRNPSLREAVDLAKSVGWTSAQGMAGLSSEKALMDKLGVPTKLVSGADWGTFANEAKTGNPVTISTQGHYFTADGWDPQTNRFHVGRSGLDLKGGSEWMTPEQMTAVMGPVQGGLLADNPQVAAPSIADQDTNPAGWLDRAKNSIVDSLAPPKPTAPTEPEGAAVLPGRSSIISPMSEALGIGGGPMQQAASIGEPQPLEQPATQPETQSQNVWDRVGSGIADVFRNAFSPSGGPMTPAMQPTPSDTLTNPLGTGNAPSQAGLPQPSEPGLPVRQDLRDIAQEPRPTVFDALGTGARAAERALISPEGELQMPPEESVAAASAALQRGIPGLSLLPSEPVRAAGAAIAPLAKGPLLLSQQELLAQASPEQIETARQFAMFAHPREPGYEPTREEIAEALRGFRIGEAAAMTEGSHGAADDVARALRGESIPPRPAEGIGTPPVRPIPERPLPEGARPIELTPAQEVERLRLDMFPEEVRPAIQEAAENVDFARQQRRGVIPDEEANRLADEWANDHHLDQVIRQGPAGKAYNTEELRALRNATGAQGARVADAAAAIKAGDDSSAALQTFWNEAERLQRLVTIAEGGKAEWGRAGRALNEPVRLVDLPPNEAVAQITKLLGGDRERLVGAINEYQKLIDSGAGPIQQAEFWTNLKTPPMNLTNPSDYLEWLKAIRYNSMLSGPRTAEINTISFLSELPWRLTRDVGASVLRGRPEEIGPEVSGILAGLGKGNTAFMEALTKGLTTEQALRGEIPRGLAPRVRNPVGKAVATAIDAPGRVLGAADQWAVAIARDMAMGRRAGQIASREGLSGKEWNARVAEVLANPPRGVEKEATEIADRMVFHGDMGNLGDALMKVADVPVVGNLLLPFVRTSYQLTSRGIERSPLGAVGTAIDVARGAYGRDIPAALRGEGPRPKGVTPLGERAADNLMGTAVFTYFYQQAMGKNITGAGPQNAADRDLLRSEGWQPYSIKIGDQWVSYANWGPLAIPLSLAAATAESQQFAKPGAQPGELFVDGARRTAQVLTEQTYLQGIASIYRGFTDPERYGAQAVHNTVTSLLPYGGALNTLAQAQDPYARKVEGFDPLKAIQSRLPPETPLIGGREEVPIAQDVLGRPLPNTRAGVGAINPLLVSEERHDPVLEELDRVGVTVPPPPKTVTRGGTEFQLTPEEQRALQSEGGDLIAERLGAEFAEDGYKRLTDQAKARRIELIMSYARTQTNNNWLTRLSEEDYQRRRAAAEGRKEIVPVSGR